MLLSLSDINVTKLLTFPQGYPATCMDRGFEPEKGRRRLPDSLSMTMFRS